MAAVATVTPVAVLDVLRGALLRIAPPACWTDTFYARDAHGNNVSTNADDAVCWCGEGAVYAERDLSAGDDDVLAAAALEQLRMSVRALYPHDVPLELVNVNDGFGHTPVLQVYAHAINRLREQS